MPTVVYNPGEPVFNQSTGEPYVDDDGSMVVVAPGLRIETSDGRVLDGDDVANAGWWHGSLREGEAIRDKSIGVPYEREALGQSDAGLAMTVITGEVVRRTPGVLGLVDQRATVFRDRVLQFASTLLRADGSSQDTKTLVQ